MNGMGLNENVSLWADRDVICLYTNVDYSTFSGVVTLKYTKTTTVFCLLCHFTTVECSYKLW